MAPSGKSGPTEGDLAFQSSQESAHLLFQSESPLSARNEMSAEVQLRHARRLLYLSHLLNQFSENAWQFCLVLFLAAFSNYESLVLVSTYGLCSGLFVCSFGARIGRFIDDADRLFVARLFIGLENFSVLTATALCYTLLSDRRSVPFEHELDNHFTTRMSGVPADPKSVVLLIGIHFLGALARVLDSGFVVAIERDWIVVMSESISVQGLTNSQSIERQKAWLTETNIFMKQIDLSSKIVAPAVAGFIVAFLDDGTDPHHGSDLRGAALFVGCLNATALVVEYICTFKIFHQIPNLATKPNARGTSYCDEAEDGDRKCRPVSLPEGLKVYLQQTVSWAGIGLSLLYLNVLTFGGIMTAYLVWRGMSLEAIGIWRGVSAAAGLAGTFAYNYLSKRINLVQSGMLSITFQFLCLSLCYASLFVDEFQTSLGMLISGVCASRVGLWVFDISVTQLMQLHIPDGVRGLVGGVQESLNSFFFLLSFALGILIPDPQYFHIYVGVGYIGVALAVLCFAFGIFPKQRELGPGAG